MALTFDDCIGDHAPGQLLRHVTKLIRTRLEQKLAERNSTSNHCLALKLLDSGLVVNAGGLARELGMTTGGVTRLVDALEAMGWVDRGRTADDRRQVRLIVTPEGRSEVRRIAPTLVREWNEILSVFAEGEVEDFVRLLTIMRQVLQAARDLQLETAG